ASIYVTAGILEALYAREVTGLGQFVDVSMLGASIALQRTRLAEFFATGQQPPLLGSACATAVPHQAFQCQDQQYLAIGVEEDSQWRRLCAALDAKDLAEEPRFAENPGRVRHREEVVSRLQDILLTKPLAWWHLQLTRHKVPCSRVWDFETMKYHPQITRNRYMPRVRTAWGPTYHGGVPWHFSKTPARMEGGATPGQHTEEIKGLLQGTQGREQATSPANNQSPNGPLAGLVVLELTQGFAGPYTGQLLGDGGAEVIKAEPLDGDYTRRLGPPFQDGQSPAFLALNRNKKSVTLGGRVGKETLRRLIEKADVVLTDWVDTRGRRVGPSYAQIARMNPNAVVCCFSPYGERGPLKDQPGFELGIQSMVGIPGGLGHIGDPPIRLGVDASYMYAGVYGYQAVIAALLHRRRTGEGQRVGISLLGCMMNLKSAFWVCQTAPEQWLPPHLWAWTDPPNHGLTTKDLPMMLGFSRFSLEDLNEIFHELEELDPAGAAQEIWDSMASWERRTSSKVKEIWERAFANHTADEIVEVFARHNGEVIPYNTFPSLVSHPQTKSLDMLYESEHPTVGRLTLVGPAWKLSATPERVDHAPPPLLGQHTQEIVGGLK
ncbi:MAG: CoA transferase, partial [Chloroflexi bacterium]|nr:CoA transferase [Chloroflexota bacterium]